MNANNAINDLLAAPLGPEWTFDQLAEEVLVAIAEDSAAEVQEFVVDRETTTDHQSRRLLRPLLACLATKSAAESATPTNLYGGPIKFERLGREGPVWIFGQFKNRPGAVRVALRCSTSPPENSESTDGQFAFFPETSPRPAPPPYKTVAH